MVAREKYGLDGRRDCGTEHSEELWFILNSDLEVGNGDLIRIPVGGALFILVLTLLFPFLLSM